MKQRTEHKVTLSIDEMESILQKMYEHHQRNGSMGCKVTLELDYDIDYRTLCLAAHPDNAYQHNAYAECNGIRFTA